jgi:hypothetical protein
MILIIYLNENLLNKYINTHTKISLNINKSMYFNVFNSKGCYL